MAKKLLETERHVAELRDEIKDARGRMDRKKRLAKLALQRL